jgi:hypothetical protein
VQFLGPSDNDGDIDRGHLDKYAPDYSDADYLDCPILGAGVGGSPRGADRP